ncbi:upstream activation factor subunit UAF30-like isoform X2 [Canna indica]|uniref:Upstream activation factor subunit UAF30-like isoform X2 n=1 Tax=Canna indica TaxID=4628 RepID=A0AAQ3KZ70_9LILI|nr:upstream activation factor subunit UAF30-like isoform X2 [Canna indica]
MFSGRDKKEESRNRKPSSRFRPSPPFDREREIESTESMSRVLGGCRALMAAASSSAAKTGAKVDPSKLKNSGILKPIPVSPAMKEFVGASEISRTEAVKKIWEHIKLNQLQNPSNKREIQCDEKLKSIFDGREKVGMMEIAKLISPHFIKPN